MTKKSFGDIAKKISKGTGGDQTNIIPKIGTKPVGESYVPKIDTVTELSNRQKSNKD